MTRPSATVLAAVLATVLSCAVVLVLGLVLAGGRPEPSVAGLPDAGPVVGWGLPIVRLVFDLAAVATVGALLLAGVLLPSSASLSATGMRAARAAAWSAATWSVSSVVLWLLTASEAVGVPLAALTTADLDEYTAAGMGRALLLAGALTAALALACTRVRTATGSCCLLLLAGTALLPTTVSGHAASSADHELAVSSLIVHVVAAAVWAGGLLAVVLFLRRSSELAHAVRQFSAVALACFVLVALSGLLSAYERLGVSTATWTSGYGGLVLAKTAALLVLGAMGWQHRRRLLPALAAGRPGAFLSFAGLEVSVMGGAFALAVGLSRTPTPATSAPVDPVAAHGAGHETLPTTVDPVSATALLLEWRTNAVVLAVVGLLAAGYVVGVRQLRTQGTAWPRRCSGAFAGALAVGLLALSSGVATYAAAMLSVQVAQFLLLLVVVPVLLALGAPLDLLRRVRGQDGTGVQDSRSTSRTLGRLVGDPLTGMLLAAGLVFVVYRTELLGRALGSWGLFLLVNTAALAVGCRLTWPALSRGPTTQPRSPADRVAPLLAAAATLLLLTAELWFGGQLASRSWFAALGWSWVDPAADQRLAALFTASGAVLLLAVAAAAWPTGRTVSPCPDTPPDPARSSAGQRAS